MVKNDFDAKRRRLDQGETTWIHNARQAKLKGKGKGKGKGRTDGVTPTIQPQQRDPVVDGTLPVPDPKRLKRHTENRDEYVLQLKNIFQPKDQNKNLNHPKKDFMKRS